MTPRYWSNVSQFSNAFIVHIVCTLTLCLDITITYAVEILILIYQCGNQLIYFDAL